MHLNESVCTFLYILSKLLGNFSIKGFWPPMASCGLPRKFSMPKNLDTTPNVDFRHWSQLTCCVVVVALTEECRHNSPWIKTKKIYHLQVFWVPKLYYHQSKRPEDRLEDPVVCRSSGAVHNHGLFSIFTKKIY